MLQCSFYSFILLLQNANQQRLHLDTGLIYTHSGSHQCISQEYKKKLC
uniref:Uncharacterized protein n=1 Tax=Rhizophora mucronata TaxID=61149 RepID=A0A2P2QW11_RHIMU